MNIFVLDIDIKKCAQYHCDKHVVKMILEHVQMLSTTVNITNNIQTQYKSTHINHPCTIWTKQSLDNWLWLAALTWELNEEYKFRFNKNVNHKSLDVLLKLPYPKLPKKGLTFFAQAMPEIYKIKNNAIHAYRNYYIGEKSHILQYTKRSKPYWII